MSRLRSHSHPNICRCPSRVPLHEHDGTRDQTSMHNISMGCSIAAAAEGSRHTHCAQAPLFAARPALTVLRTAQVALLHQRCAHLRVPV